MDGKFTGMESSFLSKGKGRKDMGEGKEIFFGMKDRRLYLIIKRN